MSKLSELLPAGAGAKSADFVASGTLASGQTVVLKANGQVEAVGELSQTVGSGVVYNTQYVIGQSSAYDSGSNKIVIAYGQNAIPSNGYAVIGTVSGTTISFGTPVIFRTGGASPQHTATAYDSSNNKIVISYRDSANSNYGTSIVGTVSGTSISFGTPVVFLSALTQFTQAVYDSSNNKVVLAYYGTSGAGMSVVGTVSGTSISFGSQATFQASSVTALGSTFDSNLNKVVILYSQAANYAQAVVGTVSGTSISYGTPVTYQAGTIWSNAATFDSTNNKVVISYTNNSNSYYGTAVIGTVSGTTISFGTSVVFASITSYSSELGFDSNANKINIAYQHLNATTGKLVVGTVSGTSISFGSAINTPPTNDNSAENLVIFDSGSNKMVVSYRDDSNNSGTSYVFQNVSTNNTSFVGITDQVIANTATGSVVVQGGVNSKVTGLTIGADYFVQADGSLNTATSVVNYDITNASFTQAFSVSSQDSAPQGVAFNADGTKMFITGAQGQDVNEYALSTGFDVSTASFTDAFSVSAQDTAPAGIAFNGDGTKMFIVGNTGDDINEYTLSGGFDVSTSSFVDSFSVSGQETGPWGLAFNSDGTKMFVCGNASDNVNEYALSTGFDVSTASFTDAFSIGSQDTGPLGLAFNAAGTQMFVLGQTGKDVNEYALSTGFDVSTASFVGTFSVASQETYPNNIAFSSSGAKMFVTGNSPAVNQYATTSTSTNSSTVPAGRALSTSSILLEG